jgi:hypothetical protein
MLSGAWQTAHPSCTEFTAKTQDRWNATEHEGPIFLRLECSYSPLIGRIMNREDKQIPSIRSGATDRHIYRVSQEESAILREGVPYIKIYRYITQNTYIQS